MIGKPEWFQRRKYGGWGITPKSWQGWLYMAAVLVPFAIFQALPFWSTKVRVIVTALWAAFLVADVTHIMIQMKRDERELLHEALAERNALWAMMLVIVLGLLYQLITTSLAERPQIDPILVAALIAGVVAKSISNIYLEKRA